MVREDTDRGPIAPVATYSPLKKSVGPHERTTTHRTQPDNQLLALFPPAPPFSIGVLPHNAVKQLPST
jgi:hypothetical protein